MTWVLITLVAALLGGAIAAWSPMALVVHESGHAIAGFLVGFRLLRITFGEGRPLFVRRVCGVDVVIGRWPTMGRVVVARDDDAGWRWRFATMCAGGPLANVFVAIVAFTAAARQPNLLIAGLFYTLAVANAIYVINLFAFGPNGDGRQILQMYTGSAAFIRSRWLGALEHEVAAHVLAGRLDEATFRAAALLARAPESALAKQIVADLHDDAQQ